MMGDVRASTQIKRTYSLIPLDYARAQEFLGFYFNQEFFLDKYMVATAFGLSLAFMVAGWYGAAGYLRTRRPAPLVLLAGSLVGMLGFHSLVGFVTMVGIFGGAILAWLLRNRREPFPMRPVLVLLAVSLATFLATTPYLYAVMHLKEKEQVFPLSVSLPRPVASSSRARSHSRWSFSGARCFATGRCTRASSSWARWRSPSSVSSSGCPGPTPTTSWAISCSSPWPCWPESPSPICGRSAPALPARVSWY
jgi:hypothetical protein